MGDRYLFDGSMTLCPESVKDGIVVPDFPLKWHEMRHDVTEERDPVAWAVEYVRAYEREDVNLRKWCAANGEPVESTPYVFAVAPDGVSLISVRADTVNLWTTIQFIRFGEGWTDGEKARVLDAFRKDGS